MRILQMMGGGDVGGAKTHIMTLIQALRERNEVMLISFRDGPFPREAAKNGINVRVIPSFTRCTAGMRCARSSQTLSLMSSTVMAARPIWSARCCAVRR